MIKEKPERKINRRFGYNYSYPDFYFLTICTDKRKYVFGKIKKGKMYLNKNGRFIKKCWQDIPKHFFNIKLDKFIIMPNHIHGILEIVGDRYICPVEQKRNVQLIPIVIGTFKATVSRYFNKYRRWFKWQRSYHDRIILSDEELNVLRQYIYYNPAIWYRDRNNIEY